MDNYSEFLTKMTGLRLLFKRRNFLYLNFNTSKLKINNFNNER